MNNQSITASAAASPLSLTLIAASDVLCDTDVSARELRSLLELAANKDLSIAELVYQNESHWRDADEIEQRRTAMWEAMQACVERGLNRDGVLPGRMSVVRRAPKIRRRLETRGEVTALDAMDWVNAFAIAVNEENASGGRVVTSPTNGAAGILTTMQITSSRFMTDASEAGIRNFLLTAGAIGILY